MTFVKFQLMNGLMFVMNDRFKVKDIFACNE